MKTRKHDWSLSGLFLLVMLATYTEASRCFYHGKLDISEASCTDNGGNISQISGACTHSGTGKSPAGEISRQPRFLDRARFHLGKKKLPLKNTENGSNRGSSKKQIASNQRPLTVWTDLPLHFITSWPLPCCKSVRRRGCAPCFWFGRSRAKGDLKLTI